MAEHDLMRVARNCFQFPDKASEVERLAGALMTIQAFKDNQRIEQHLQTLHGGNAWRASRAAKNTGCAQKVEQPYDKALVGVVDSWMQTTDVVRAYMKKHPKKPAPPSNFSQALRRLWNNGLIDRKRAEKPFERTFLWGPLAKETEKTK